MTVRAPIDTPVQKAVVAESSGKRRRNTAHLRDHTRQVILEAATQEFAERGYFDVSIRDIARRAGVAQGLAYHYFDSKESLFAAQVAYTTGIWIEEFLAWRESRVFASLPDFLADYLLFMRHFIQEGHPAYFRFYMKHIHIDNLPHLDFFFDRVSMIQPYFQREIDAARRRGELRADLDPQIVVFQVETLSSRLQEAFYSDFLGMGLGIFKGDPEEIRQNLHRLIACGLAGVLEKTTQ